MGSCEDVGFGVPVEPEIVDGVVPDVNKCVPDVDGLVADRAGVVAAELGGRELTVELTITVDGVVEAEPEPDRLAPDPDIGPVPDIVAVIDSVDVDPVVGGSSVPTVLMVASSSVVGAALSWPPHPASANTATSSAAHLLRSVNVVISPPTVEAPVSPNSVPDPACRCHRLSTSGTSRVGSAPLPAACPVRTGQTR